MTTVSYKNKLAVVIATKDRPKEIYGVLSNLGQQTCQPHQVIVVDGSDNPDPSFVHQFPELSIEYVRVYPPALTKQKNAALTVVRPDITLIGFIDDDIVFEDRSLEAMMTFWEDAPDKTGGAAFNLTGYQYSTSWLTSLPKRLFFIDDREFGRVLRSGFNTPIWDTRKTRSARWLGGGYTVWRREVFDRWRFDEWFVGSGLWEDVYFSYRVGAEYQFAVVAEARATHAEGPISPKAQVSLGKRQIVNWMYFVSSNPELSKSMCFWACIGRMATTLSKGILTFDGGLMLRAAGNSLGIATIVFRPLMPRAGRPDK